VLKKAGHILLKGLVLTLGRTSTGITTAFKHGFTSGVMLEYIYCNHAQGKFLIGRLIDRIYLSHTGWRVIRTRKENLESLLQKAVDLQREAGRQPVILDVASGPGQYLLDVLARPENHDLAAVCRDMDDTGMALGRVNARERGIDTVRFEKGDALSRESLARVEPKPNIIISSGFYDWITDDNLVRKSMSLIHELLPAAGCFVFTNQSGHIDLEMVQSIFVDFKGQPLRMTVRPAEQVNGWAEQTGFSVLESVRDRLGHYTVSLCRKP